MAAALMDNHHRLDHGGCVIGTVADATGGDHDASDGARSGYLQRFSSISSSFARSKAARSNAGNSNNRRSRCSSIGGDSLADGDGAYDGAFVDCATSDSGKSRTGDGSHERQRNYLATEGFDVNAGGIVDAPQSAVDFKDASERDVVGAAGALLDYDDSRDESFKSAVSHSSQPSFGSCTSFQSRTSLGSHMSHVSQGLQGSQGSRRSSGAVSVKKIRAAKVLNYGNEDPHVSTIPEFAEWNCPPEPSASDSAQARAKRSSALSRLKARLHRSGGSGDAETSAEKQENPPPQQPQEKRGYKYTAQFKERYEQVKDRSKFDWQGEYGNCNSAYGASLCDGNSTRYDGSSIGGGGSVCGEDVGVNNPSASAAAAHAAPDAVAAPAAVATTATSASAATAAAAAAAAAASLMLDLSQCEHSELAEAHNSGDGGGGKGECDGDSRAMAVAPTSAITPAAAEATTEAAAATAESEAEVAAAMEAAEESEPSERQVIPARFYGTSRFTAMFSQRAARRRNEKAAAAAATAAPAAETDDVTAATSIPQSPTTAYTTSSIPTASPNAAIPAAVSPTAVSMCTPTSASTGKGSRLDRSDTSEPSSSRNSSSSISSSSLASTKLREGSTGTEKLDSIPAGPAAACTELTASQSQKNGGRRSSSGSSPFENMAWPTPQPKLAARISREKKRAKLQGLWALFQRML
ncbi:unnamed protein product [Closterium sp. NIES-64]|nr:unnamed protein product [Closterium sp. NIES-64]CAI5992210.1 unnamed protein product [Closterium sp. NIES-65]